MSIWSRLFRCRNWQNILLMKKCLDFLFFCLFANNKIIFTSQDPDLEEKRKNELAKMKKEKKKFKGKMKEVIQKKKEKMLKKRAKC